MDERFKFRAWNYNKMIYFGEGEISFSAEGKAGMFFPMIDEKFYMTKFEPMQCTGLKDKNGKLIYEGDILRNTSNPTWSLQQVRYGYCKSWVVDDYTDKQANPVSFKMKKCCYLQAADIIYEVIGNIYENPDLMEQEVAK